MIFSILNSLRVKMFHQPPKIVVGFATMPETVKNFLAVHGKKVFDTYYHLDIEFRDYHDKYYGGRFISSKKIQDKDVDFLVLDCLNKQDNDDSNMFSTERNVFLIRNLIKDGLSKNIFLILVTDGDVDFTQYKDFKGVTKYDVDFFHPKVLLLELNDLRENILINGNVSNYVPLDRIEFNQTKDILVLGEDSE